MTLPFNAFFAFSTSLFLTYTLLFFHVPFNPTPTQVDSTAAGDSFAGTYLISRVNGNSVLQAIENADKVAREVVQHPGAIMNIELYNKAFK